MKTIHQLLIASLAVLGMASCSSDDQQVTIDGAQQFPIRLSANMAQPASDATRASGNYETGFLSGSEFWVWADMNDEGESDPRYKVKEFISSWRLTINSTDQSTFDAETAHTFPVYNKLSFYAMHGNFTNAITEEASSFPGLLTHNVKTVQTSDDEYLSSDLVYAVKPDVVPQADVVPLQFYHMLTKVEVALKAGNMMTEDQMKNVDETKVTVSIVGTKTQVQFRPSKDTGSAPDLLTGRQSMLTAVENSERPIVLSTVTTDDFTNGTCAAAIVVPQTVNGHLIQLSYQGHNTYYDVTNLNLLSGYRYRFNLTVDRIGETYTIKGDELTMEPWNDLTSSSMWVE